MRVAEKTTHDAGTLPAVPTAPSAAPAVVRPRRRRGTNREGLEAGRRGTRTLLWTLLAAAMVLYGFPFL